jgi:hypothetical protein
MKYEIALSRTGVYGILENTSGTFINMSNTKKSTIESVCDNLNWGTGFQGHTPNFIANFSPLVRTKRE